MLIQGCSDVSIARSGVRNDFVCDLMWGAHFKFDTDVSILFPYINGSVKEARYYDRPPHVRFNHQGVHCSLYPGEAMAAPFRGREHAMAFIEQLVNFFNDLYDRRDALTPNHKIYRQPVSIVDIVKILPRTNCRQCGYATCLAFAAALRNGEVHPSECPEFPEPISTQSVYPVFGENQTLESTVSIETESPQTRTAVNRQEKLDHDLSADKTPLYDRYGIRIQYNLTPREIQVLRLVADGASNPEISELLHISPHTVKSHVIHIFNKLNVNDRTQAAVWAARNQVV